MRNFAHDRICTVLYTAQPNWSLPPTVTPPRNAKGHTAQAQR